MGYVYAALWFIVGMILVFKMGKENKAFFAVGGFFFFWGSIGKRSMKFLR